MLLLTEPVARRSTLLPRPDIAVHLASNRLSLVNQAPPWNPVAACLMVKVRASPSSIEPLDIAVDGELLLADQTFPVTRRPLGSDATTRRRESPIGRRYRVYSLLTDCG